jgi:hypothetical protein
VYRHAGLWVFDDEDVGLRREPFVRGVDRMIDILVKKVRGAEEGFNLMFSASPFPGHQLSLMRLREEHGGSWYYCHELDFEGWLCPALHKYFEQAPDHLYVEALARPDAA